MTDNPFKKNGGTKKKNDDEPNNAAVQSDLEKELDKEQAAIRDDLLLGHRLKGEDRFLVENGWYQQWERYVGMTSKPGGNQANHPGPIDNSPLVDPETRELKPELVECRDFVSFRENSWNLLAQRYGISEKWPTPIVRKVVPASAHSQLNKTEIYPPTVNFRYFTDLDSNFSTTCSVMLTLGDFEQLLRQLFKITYDHHIQIWHRSSPTGPAESFSPLKYKPNDTLQQYNVENGSLFFVENRPSILDDWPSSLSILVEAAKKRGICLQHTDALPPPDYDTSLSAIRLDNFFEEENAGFQGVANSENAAEGLCGLQNLGNTCFMNSAIQCLSNVPELTQFFLSGDYKDDLNRTNKLGTKGQLADRYALLVEALWSRKYSSVAPRDFKSTVGQFAPRFLGYSQQDSSELLSFVLEGLHEDLNKVTVKPYLELDDKSDTSDAQLGQEFWDYHRNRNDSKIVDLFHGQLKSTLTCNICQHVVRTFDPFCQLTVPLPKPTSRKMTAHFRYSDPKKPVVTVQLGLSLDFTLKELKTALSAEVDVLPERIRVCTVAKTYHASLSHWFEDHDRAVFISNNDDVMGFEVDQSVDVSDIKDAAQVVFYVKAREFHRIYPFLRLIAKPHRLTSLDVLNMAEELIGNFRKPHVEKIDVDGEEKTDERSSVRDFQLLRANISGVYEREEVKPDEEQDAEQFERDSILKTHYLIINCSNNDRFDFEKLAGSNYSQLARSDGSAMATNSEIQLDDCFRLFLSQEQLSERDSWYCPKCKDHQRAFKKFDLWRAPPCLLIQLKRFDQEGHRVEKLDAFVRYPFQLDLSGYLPKDVSDLSGSTHYDLIAVSNHFGSLGFGHYTAYALNKTTGQWYLFDDSSVTSVESNKQEIISEAGYILFYKRRSASISTDA